MAGKGGDALAQTVVELVADPNGIKTGTDQAKVYLAQWGQVAQKLPGADALAGYTKSWKEFMAGFGTVMVASKAVDWA